MTQGIYAIINKVNGKVYIGSSKNIEKRFNTHKTILKSGKHESLKLQKEWNEYSADSFEFSIIQEIEESINLTEIEQEFIEQYKAWQAYNTRKANRSKPRKVATKALLKPQPRTEINRQYYAKRTASLKRRYCTQCDRQLRSDSTREICRTCWRKSDEGKEYLRQMKVKSREKNR